MITKMKTDLKILNEISNKNDIHKTVNKGIKTWFLGLIVFLSFVVCCAGVAIIIIYKISVFNNEQNLETVNFRASSNPFTNAITCRGYQRISEEIEMEQIRIPILSTFLPEKSPTPPQQSFAVTAKENMPPPPPYPPPPPPTSRTKKNPTEKTVSEADNPSAQSASPAPRTASLPNSGTKIVPTFRHFNSFELQL
jgi:hypothetical protein